MTLTHILNHRNAVTSFYEYFFLTKEGRKISPNSSLFAVCGDFYTSKHLCETFFLFVSQGKSNSERRRPGLVDTTAGLSDSKAHTVSITLLSSHYSSIFTFYSWLFGNNAQHSHQNQKKKKVKENKEKRHERPSSLQPTNEQSWQGKSKKSFLWLHLTSTLSLRYKY